MKKQILYLSIVVLISACGNQTERKDAADNSITNEKSLPTLDELNKKTSQQKDTVAKPPFDPNGAFQIVEEGKPNINIPEVTEPPLIVQEECYFKKGRKPTKGKIDTRNWSPLTIENGIRYEGKVCITNKDFQGSSPYNIPFVATILGNVSELYVNNKRIKFDGPGEIFFRLKIALEMGYNRVPVQAIGKSGEATESFVEININETSDKIVIEQK